MRDRPLIGAALLVFLAVATYPFWYARLAGTTPAGPDPKLPREERQCVAPTAYMRASHMDLLIDWRELVVRRGETTFVAGDGRRYTMGLSKTCLRCHTSKAEFCDRCHDYAAVSVPCWDCHVDPAARTAGVTALARPVAGVSARGER
jgi:hypothetical protein